MIYQTKCVCDRFQYGGCAGNANNFFTEGECVRTCAEGTASSNSGDSRDQEDVSSGEMGVSRAQEVGVSRSQREGRRRPPAMRDACLLPEDIGMKKHLLLYRNCFRDFLNIFKFINPTVELEGWQVPINCKI
jgi:hypothetical protein